MRTWTTTILVSIATAASASRQNVRKRSLTPYGSFDEHDYVLSIVPATAKQISKSKTAHRKSANAHKRRKGKGRNKSSGKQTPCPEDAVATSTPEPEGSVSTQSPAVTTPPPQISPTTTPPQISPTTEPTLVSPPTLETEIAPTSRPITSGDFETTLNLDQVPSEYHSAFRNAAAKWDSIIVGDLEDYPIFDEDRTNPELICDGDSLPEIVDDVFICASLPEIDGPSGILGSAGPIYGRIGDFVQTSVGYMQFDLADVAILAAQGRLDGLILHEMAHVYGTGTLWGQNGLVADTSDCPYSYNSRASEEYRALSGCDTAVPIETRGGPGTACLHWDGSCFRSELMTGVSTGDQELSRVSIATLEDMGYVVDYSKADPFPVERLDPSCVCNANLRHENKFQLSNGASMFFRWNENRRSLRHDSSEKEREEAIQYGKKKLKENHRSAELMTRNFDPRRVYLSDKVVLVLYFDKDEQVKSVIVTEDS